MIKYVVMYTEREGTTLVAQYDSLEEAQQHIKANVGLRFEERTIDGRRHWSLIPPSTSLEITELYLI